MNPVNVDSSADTRGHNKLMFDYQDGPLILPPSCLFNVTVSITDDLFASRGSIHVTEHVIPMEFLKQPSKYI